jgi:Ankyrin repeat
MKKYILIAVFIMFTSQSIFATKQIPTLNEASTDYIWNISEILPANKSQSKQEEMDLLIAIYNNDMEGVKKSTQSAINLNFQMSIEIDGVTQEYSPLIMAIRFERFEIIDILLKNGADTNFSITFEPKNKEKVLMRPLYIASHIENKDIIAKLLENGLNLSLPLIEDEKRGQLMPLQAISQSNDLFVWLLEYIEKNGIAFNEQDFNMAFLFCLDRLPYEPNLAKTVGFMLQIAKDKKPLCINIGLLRRQSNRAFLFTTLGTIYRSMCSSLDTSK